MFQSISTFIKDNYCSKGHLFLVILISFIAFNNVSAQKLDFNGANNNALTSLNIVNGNNTNFNYFNTTNNPGLTCIEVDNTAYATTNWTNIDDNTMFSEDCATLSIKKSLKPEYFNI